MTHASATLDPRPRFTIPRWNPALNILAPLAGVVLLAALVAGPTFGGSEVDSPSATPINGGASGAALDDSLSPLERYRAAAAALEPAD